MAKTATMERIGTGTPSQSPSLNHRTAGGSFVTEFPCVRTMARLCAMP